MALHGVYCHRMIAFASEDLGLQPAQWKAVQRQASRAGMTPPQYVRHLIEQGLLAAQTFDEILRPIRRDVRKSGLTESKLDAIVRRARRRTAAAPKSSKPNAKHPRR